MPKRSAEAYRLLLDGLKGSRASVVASDVWLHVRFKPHLARQGWKIHVSSTPSGLNRTIELAVPVLANFKVNFKVVASEHILNRLNTSPVQVGKAIAVYPDSDEIAVAIAKALKSRLRGLVAPKIPSDRRLCRESVVHYRYGSFVKEFDDMNRAVSYLNDASGNKIPDSRSLTYNAPSWLKDPFIRAGVASRQRPGSGPLGSRYKISKYYVTGTTKKFVFIASSKKGEVLIKFAGDNLNNEQGVPLATLLKHEYDILKRLGGSGGAPRPIELFRQNEALYLVEQAIPAESLYSYVQRMLSYGVKISDKERSSIIKNAVSKVREVHEMGIVLEDLSANNMVLDANKEIHLIDFEYAHYADEKWYSAWTPGFSPPKEPARRRSAFGRDLHSLAGVVFYIATGRLPFLQNGVRDSSQRLSEYLRMPWAADCKYASQVMEDLASEAKVD